MKDYQKSREEVSNANNVSVENLVVDQRTGMSDFFFDPVPTIYVLPNQNANQRIQKHNSKWLTAVRDACFILTVPMFVENGVHLRSFVCHPVAQKEGDLR